VGLQHYLRRNDLRAPASHRLAFRELGLSIGLAALPIIAAHGSGVAIAPLQRFAPLREEIESFWLDPAHREARTWLDHPNINDVMLATSLDPAGYLSP
jgi:hypothetical protein